MKTKKQNKCKKCKGSGEIRILDEPALFEKCQSCSPKKEKIIKPKHERAFADAPYAIDYMERARILMSAAIIMDNEAAEHEEQGMPNAANCNIGARDELLGTAGDYLDIVNSKIHAVTHPLTINKLFVP